MATKRWIGGAAPIAQVQTYTFGGTWEADDIIRAKIGNKQLDFTAGSTTTATVVSNLVTAWNELSSANYPEFAEITASADTNDLVLTAETAGVPFTCTLTPYESDGTTAADAQTIEGAGTATTGTATTACTGPNFWSEALNWDTGTVPVNSDDVYFSNSAVDCLYDLAQSGVTLTSLTIEQSFTGKIGLPDHTGVYTEYRDKYLAIGATTLNVGYGPGNGSTLLRINGGSVQTTLNVFDTATSSEPGVETLVWKGTHASNVVNVTKGILGIAVKPGETATVATLRIGWEANQEGDAQVRCGAGTTLTTIEKSGGMLEVSSNFTTLNHTGGTTYINGSATATTMNIDGGTVFDRSSGTKTTVKIGSDAKVDRTQDLRAVTYTNTTITKGGTLIDPYRTITFTNPIALDRCGLEDVILGLGEHITLQRANGS